MATHGHEDGEFHIHRTFFLSDWGYSSIAPPVDRLSSSTPAFFACDGQISVPFIPSLPFEGFPAFSLVGVLSVPHFFVVLYADCVTKVGTVHCGTLSWLGQETEAR